MQVAVINGKEVEYILKKINNSVSFYLTGEGYLHPFQLCFYKTGRHRFKDFSLLTPEIFLNFNASPEEIDVKLKTLGAPSLPDFIDSLPPLAKSLYECFSNEILPVEKLKIEPEGYKSSLFTAPKVGNRMYEFVFVFENFKLKRSINFKKYLYQFGFNLPEILTEFGIFVEGSSIGWFHSSGDILQICTTQEVPEKSFYFLKEGKLIELSELSFPKEGVIKKIGKNTWKIQLPFLDEDKKFREIFCKIICKVLSKEAKKECLNNCIG